jgi:hypothetical protein
MKDVEAIGLHVLLSSESSGEHGLPSVRTEDLLFMQ